MKLRALALFLFAAGLSAQTVTVPTPTASVVSLNWTLSACTTAAPCTFAVYRVPGTVTITPGLTGATLLTTTPAQTFAYTDSTVTAGSTYSYALLATQGNQTSLSNTYTASVPTGLPGAVLSGSTTVTSTTTTVTTQ